MATICQGCGATLAASRSNQPRKWCSDRCRKRSYGDPCVDCGTRTRFGAESARVAEPRCHSCAVEHRRVWTRELVLARIREWNDIYGEPPATHDWNAYGARKVLRDADRARRFQEANGHWPSFKTVYALCGTWNAALVAAGFTPRSAHGGDGNELRSRIVRAAA